MKEPPTLDRSRGTLIGLAVGDALGAAIEFQPPGSFSPVTGYRGGGPHGLDAGEWTDDTSMALALAESIATAGWDLDDQAARYVQWWKSGKHSVNGRCFDIGITTSGALSEYMVTRDARKSGDRSDQTRPAATAPSCGSRPCQFDSAISTPCNSINCPDWRPSRVCRPMRATNVLRRVDIWPPSWPR